MSFVHNFCFNFNIQIDILAGGTFALYSLLCRHSKMGLLNASYAAQENASSVPSEETRTSLLLKEFFQKHRSSRIVLLLVVLLGTSMVIGDGILTPTMSGVYNSKHEKFNQTVWLFFAAVHDLTFCLFFSFSPMCSFWN